MNRPHDLPAVETDRSPFQSPSNPRLRILVVEDDADIRHLNTEVLTRNGYHVDAAEDGAFAWKALTSQSYDLLVTDNSMPKVTGFELLRKLHEARMPVPVIMATSVLPEWKFRQNPELTPAAMLVKPYTVPELLRAVKTVLHQVSNPAETAGQSSYGQGQPLTHHLPL